MSSPASFKHSGPHVLLTEGLNDCHLISALCVHFDVPKDRFGLYRCDSDTQVLQRLSALLATSVDMETIGVVLDADAPSLEGKWAALKNRLTAEGYEVPDGPAIGGTILRQSSKPTIGAWLMPDNAIDGMLEDFCMRLAPPQAISYAMHCVGEAQAQSFSSFGTTHFAKAAIHTYLSWQDEPGMPLGQAVTRKALDPTQPIASDFHTFLRNLFFEKCELKA